MQYIEKNSVLCFHLQRFQSVIIADNCLACQYVPGRVSGKHIQPHNTGPGGPYRVPVDFAGYGVTATRAK